MISPLRYYISMYNIHNIYPEHVTCNFPYSNSVRNASLSLYFRISPTEVMTDELYINCAGSRNNSFSLIQPCVHLRRLIICYPTVASSSRLCTAFNHLQCRVSHRQGPYWLTHSTISTITHVCNVRDPVHATERHNAHMHQHTLIQLTRVCRCSHTSIAMQP